MINWLTAQANSIFFHLCHFALGTLLKSPHVTWPEFTTNATCSSARPLERVILIFMFSKGFVTDPSYSALWPGLLITTHLLMEGTVTDTWLVTPAVYSIMYFVCFFFWLLFHKFCSGHVSYNFECTALVSPHIKSKATIFFLINFKSIGCHDP